MCSNHPISHTVLPPPSMSSPVALIFGAGKNIGAGVAKALTANGYKVAVASRTDKHNLSDDQYFHTSCDLADPSSVEQTFEAVRAKLGHPSVVVYNGRLPSMKCAQDPS